MDNLFEDIAEVAPDISSAPTNVNPVLPTVEPAALDTPVDLWGPEGHPMERKDLSEPAKYEPKNDPKRVEYWQSQADKAKQAASQREAELKAREVQYAELAQLDAYLRENPSVVEKLRGELKTDSPRVDAGLVKPTKPVAPEGYNEVEAFNDPQSASWKHRKAVDTYRESLDEYYEKREMVKEQEMHAAAQAQQQQAQYQQAIRQTYSVLQQQHGLQPQEAQEFVQMFSDDSSITLDNLVKLYRVLKQPVSARQPDRITRQVTQSRIPQPVSTVTSTQGQQYSDEDMFNLGLLSSAKRKG